MSARSAASSETAMWLIAQLYLDFEGKETKPTQSPPQSTW